MKKMLLYFSIGVALIFFMLGTYNLIKSPKQGGFIKTNTLIQNGYVILDQVYLICPGYVVVHKNNNEELGEIIGVSEFITGIEENLIIFTTKDTDSVIVKIYYGSGNFPEDIEEFSIDKAEEATIVIDK